MVFAAKPQTPFKLLFTVVRRQADRVLLQEPPCATTYSRFEGKALLRLAGL
jgi:hypothetical protein